MKDYKEFYDKITGFISKSPKRIRLLNLADKAMEMIMYGFQQVGLQLNLSCGQ